MSNLVSAVKFLLINLSSGTKSEYIIGSNTVLAKVAYSVLNIIFTHYWVPATLLYKFLDRGITVFEALKMLLGIHVQTFEYVWHMDEEGGRHLALAWTLT